MQKSELRRRSRHSPCHLMQTTNQKQEKKKIHIFTSNSRETCLWSIRCIAYGCYRSSTLFFFSFKNSIFFVVVHGKTCYVHLITISLGSDESLSFVFLVTFSFSICSAAALKEQWEENRKLTAGRNLSMQKQSQPGDRDWRGAGSRIRWVVVYSYSAI